ncbi:hypothetical protein SAMN05216390_1024 [Lachnospiraceae bacterium KH1T2]|nr:hypothetical protein SAMN05216390_1024 [Lachnospiraceae bacterium KH1T2]
MAGEHEIGNSTLEERRAYIKERYPCISGCDMCGLCKVFRGKDAETAYKDYIDGNNTMV